MFRSSSQLTGESFSPIEIPELSHRKLKQPIHSRSRSFSPSEDRLTHTAQANNISSSIGFASLRNQRRPASGGSVQAKIVDRIRQASQTSSARLQRARNPTMPDLDQSYNSDFDAVVSFEESSMLPVTEAATPLRNVSYRRDPPAFAHAEIPRKRSNSDPQSVPPKSTKNSDALMKPIMHGRDGSISSMGSTADLIDGLRTGQLHRISKANGVSPVYDDQVSWMPISAPVRRASISSNVSGPTDFTADLRSFINGTATYHRQANTNLREADQISAKAKGPAVASKTHQTQPGATTTRPLERLEAELAARNQELDDASEKQRDELTRLRLEHENEIASLKETHKYELASLSDSYKREFTALSATHEQKSTEAMAKEQELSTLRRELALAQTDNKRLSSALDVSQLEQTKLVTAAKVDLDAVKAEKAVLQRRVQDLQVKKEALGDITIDVEERQQEEKAHDQRIKQLERSLRRAEAESKTKDEKIEAKEELIELNMEAIEVKDKELKTKEELIQKCNVEIKRKEEMLKAKNEQLDRLSAAVEDANEERNEAEAKADRLEAEALKLEAEVQWHKAEREKYLDSLETVLNFSNKMGKTLMWQWGKQEVGRTQVSMPDGELKKGMGYRYSTAK